MSSAPLLSVIIALRNRTGPRLENCLMSLRAQRTASGEPFAAGVVEILLSDFGSDPGPAREIVELADRHGARVVRTDTAALWNRSAAGRTTRSGRPCNRARPVVASLGRVLVMVMG